MDDTLIKQRMDSAIDALRNDISGIRTGRVTPALVEDIIVEAYGGTSKLRVQELASITAQDTQTLLITPWDKQVIGEIRKGIEAANIGLNPMVAGEAIRIVLPPLTQEDREKYVKLLSQKLENGRVQIRQIRQDGMKDIKRVFDDKTISEDEKTRNEKHLQDLTDDYIKQLDEIGKIKETELRTV
jgi:ribosome recycling factor